jgi:hypothetical protein
MAMDCSALLLPAVGTAVTSEPGASVALTDANTSVSGLLSLPPAPPAPGEGATFRLVTTVTLLVELTLVVECPCEASNVSGSTTEKALKSRR